MIAFDDWMVVELWEGQKDKVSVQIALPDTVDRTKSESAAFVIKQLGLGCNQEEHAFKPVELGALVVFEGDMSVVKFKKPNGEVCLVARQKDVAFRMEGGDLE